MHFNEKAIVTCIFFRGLAGLFNDDSEEKKLYLGEFPIHSEQGEHALPVSMQLDTVIWAPQMTPTLRNLIGKCNSSS